jgi:hypothetical protein
MKCKFYVGQKVVCVVKYKRLYEAQHGPSDAPFPAEGSIYTIAHIEPARSPKWGAEWFVNLSDLGWCAQYDVRAFRPLVERKTDISIFQSILERINKRELVDTDV